MSDDNKQQYKVLISIEEQYCFWPINKKVPFGWEDTGVSGDKEVCSEYVNRVWVDMRPKSLKEAMANSEKNHAIK